jgi:archaellum component FlaC
MVTKGNDEVWSGDIETSRYTTLNRLLVMVYGQGSGLENKLDYLEVKIDRLEKQIEQMQVNLGAGQHQLQNNLSISIETISQQLSSIKEDLTPIITDFPMVKRKALNASKNSQPVITGSPANEQ